MRLIFMLVGLSVAGYLAYQSTTKSDVPMATIRPCSRISAFMDAQMPGILGPLVYRDVTGRYWSHNMPMTELMQVANIVKAEAAGAPTRDKPRYQAALALCEAINDLMKEQVAAFVRFEASVQGLSRRGATWTQIVERHNARWAEQSTQLLKRITVLYQQASQTEALANGTPSPQFPTIHGLR